MRMNKKLKNVLAFGLATSFVLTSTMGALATDDVSDYGVATYGATDSTSWIAVDMNLTYVDENGTVVETRTEQYTVSTAATAEPFETDVTYVPAGYENPTNNHLYISGQDVTNWPVGEDGLHYGSQTIYVSKIEEPVVEDVTTDVIVNFRDVDTDTYIMNGTGTAYKTWKTTYTFKLGATEGYADISGVEIPEGYEAVNTPDVITVYANTELKNYYTVDVKKVKEEKPEAPAAVTKVLNVNFWDVDANTQVGDVVELSHEFEATTAADATFTFSSTKVEAPKGYKIVKMPALTLHKDYKDNWVTVDVEKVKEESPAAVTKVLKVNFWDVDANAQVGDVVELSHEFEATSEDNATYTFGATSVEAPEGYVVVKQPALILHKDYKEDWVTIDVQKKESPKAVEKVLKVNFWDVDANKQVGDVLELKHEFEATSAADATYTFSATSVEAPAGYTVVKQPALTLHKDYEEDWVTIDVQKNDVPEAVEKVLHVNFWDVDANVQVGDVVELTHVFEATSAADATFTFAGTSVEAPAGYTVVKQPALTLHKAYEEDWVTIDVQKNEVPTAVEKVLHVNFWDVDANVQVGDVVELTHEFEATSAADATFTFAGTSVEAPAGYVTVKQPALTLHKDYEEDWVTIDVQKAPEEVKRTVNVYFTVDPEKGSFPDYETSTVVSFENLDEFLDQQLEIPAVAAKEGYKFVGWAGQGADEIKWDADAKTFGVTGLAFFAEGSNVGYASIDAVFEPVEKETESESETTTETESESETTTETESESETTTETETEPVSESETTTETETEPVSETETTAPTTESETVEPTTEETTTEEATTEDETETEKKAAVTEKNNKSDDNSNKTSDSAVKTGDTTTVMPYVIALFAAAALIVVLALKRRRTF